MQIRSFAYRGICEKKEIWLKPGLVPHYVFLDKLLLRYFVDTHPVFRTVLWVAIESMRFHITKIA